ncbi:glycosyltransferase [Glycomyces albidus]|uniref:Glycosyltransferase family 1 protein n=1 Tax=Glycomyces albidus TaxID=2656774 RepID=A0A6L5GEW1_9ACTN|nr:glycosyltransferase [Glycomyces albidus]MQM28244.1 glycosyltransferase family 1 protein [Glycomyces albidus]
MRGSNALRILCWNVDGAWTESFIQGRHVYLLPKEPDSGQFGLGRAGRPWPRHVVDVPAEALRDTEIDVVVLQRPEELALAERWLGRRPGRDVAAVYVEHGTPPGRAATSRHPLADRDDIPVVHTSDFNRLMWDCGRAPTTVVDHGAADPGPRFTGELPHALAVVDEPVGRGRDAGADVLEALRAAAPIDLFGSGAEAVRTWPDGRGHALTGNPPIPLEELHTAMARRRVYVHPSRWTSPGAPLIEAMLLGLPVVAVASTAAATLPPSIGAVSCDLGVLAARLAQLAADRDLAAEAGAAAREYALAHHGLEGFLNRWDVLLERAIAT